ncbi:Peroxidase superfamily protein [Hibiscus syriacus]|uniref:Peroxidase superfamily protein n=1 Tax=Hibiscus syriacus TaxID=106335 RepID=A0A6A2X4Q3_HIBSY|nr:uncharacterized protein LOC120175779 [Hibiscus syriacus]KAE8669891.1 Peroxidase superfamily protein [Hibiscus syriacus]
MEATKSRREPSKRKPFTDLSNTTPSSLPSSVLSSSSIKPQTKSSHSWPLKSLFNDNPNADLNSNAIFTATASPMNANHKNDKKNKEDKVKGPSNEENPSPTISPPPKTPSVSGDGDSLLSELSTVYKRRQTAEKRKNNGKGIMEPSSCSLETRMPNLRKKTYGDGDIGLSKSCPMPCRKKQHREKAKVYAYKHDLPQDFIDRQRAYFAKIDAFELEEEVASADESEKMKKCK